MRILRGAAVLLCLASCAALSQSTQSTSQSSQPSASTSNRPTSPQKTAGKLHREYQKPACWKQAGLTPAIVNQRWQIQDQGKVKIAQVCSQAGLSPEQRHDKIEEINMQTDQAVAKLIPGKQLETLHACEADWNKMQPKVASEKELGPCGGVIPNSTAGSVHDHH